jgi:hypothetical protein
VVTQLPRRTVRILRMLASSSSGLSADAVADALSESGPVCATYLRRLAAHDLVRVDGAGLWHLAGVGRRRLADLDAAVERARQAEVGWQLLGGARQLFGPSTPLATRRRAAAVLHAAGVSLSAIASVFGVSASTIGQDVQVCAPGVTGADLAAVLDTLDRLAARDQPMVPYWFPLRPGLQVSLVLPEVLTRSDADRITEFVASLAEQADAPRQ